LTTPPDLVPGTRDRRRREPTSVLFACTLNRVRSPMAEALAKRVVGTRVFIDSVGVRPEAQSGEDEVDPFLAEVLDEIGLDPVRHKPKSFDQLEDASFDLVISLSPEAHHQAMELTRTMDCEVEYWPMPDPTAVEGTRDMRLDAYRQLRDMLMKRIHERLAPKPLGSL
jgi:protein-tyrosine-phosphatase